MIKKIVLGLIASIALMGFMPVANAHGHHYHHDRYRHYHRNHVRIGVHIGLRLAPGVYIGYTNRYPRYYRDHDYDSFRPYRDPRAVYYEREPRYVRVADICSDRYGNEYVCGYHYEKEY